MRSQLIFKAEDPYERCGADGCDHPRGNHRVSSSGRGFCLECQGTRPGAISSDVVHEFQPKAAITGSVGPSRLNPVPVSLTRVPHPNRSEVRMHHEALLTGLEEMRQRFHGTARDKTEKSRGKKSPACPDCGSPTTTVYPMGEGAYTLYCDTCKREKPYSPPRTQNVPDKLPRKYRKSQRTWQR